MDLARFKLKWQEFDIDEDQIKLLTKKVKEFEEEMIEKDAQRAKVAAATDEIIEEKSEKIGKSA